MTTRFIKLSIIFTVLTSTSVIAKPDINRYDIYKTAAHGFIPTQSYRLNRLIDETKQNVYQFFIENDSKNYRVQPEYLPVLKAQYLEKYYQPWKDPVAAAAMSFSDVLAIEKQNIIDYLKHPGWSENRYRHSPEWIKQIAVNMHLADYPNTQKKAITVYPTAMRDLPTIKPSFGDQRVAGQGFPFDNLQISRLRANVPVFVLHTSKSGEWFLVLTPNQTIGWVQSKDIAFISKTFEKRWMRSSYVTPIIENKPIRDQRGQFYFLTRIGGLLPLVHTSKMYYRVLVAARDVNAQAVIKQALVNKKFNRPWPLFPSSKNIAKLANEFLGIPYGWGDLYDYRDCSATTKDLFAAFAIWLPRNSTEQALSKPDVIDVAKLNPDAKRDLILKKGIPFFTLLWMPGHITTYIGNKNKHVYIFHSPWGIHTKSWINGKPGRIVIGRAVVTPLNLGQGFFNVNKTWLNETQKIVFLVPLQDIK